MLEPLCFQSHSSLVTSDVGALYNPWFPLDPTDTSVDNCLHLALDLAIALAKFYLCSPSLVKAHVPKSILFTTALDESFTLVFSLDIILCSDSTLLPFSWIGNPFLTCAWLSINSFGLSWVGISTKESRNHRWYRPLWNKMWVFFYWSGHIQTISTCARA